VAESIKESREQLSKLARVIEHWATVMSLEHFFAGVERRVENLPEEQRQEMLRRFALLAILLEHKIRRISSVHGKHPLNDTYRGQ